VSRERMARSQPFGHEKLIVSRKTRSLLSAEDAYPGKSLLAGVVCMLITMHKTAANRISAKTDR